MMNQIQTSQKLDFLIVGTQKSGTTALDYFLRQNPSVQMPRNKKELHFFDNEKFDWDNPIYDDYHTHFDLFSNAKVRGEATPIYMFWPDSIERIRRYNPDLKLICILRNPSFRAFSHWRMECARNTEKLSFSDAIRIGRDRININEQFLRNYSYVERGFYYQQAQRILDNFKRQQVFFITSDLLRQNSLLSLNRINDFIQADHFSNVNLEYISPIENNLPYSINSEDLAFLSSLYKNDILQTMELTGCDLSAWQKPDYQEINIVC